MSSHQQAIEAAEKIDQLLTLDLPRRGRINPIYDHFSAFGAQPLSWEACEPLTSLQPGELVLIATGFLNRPQVTSAIAESDGPTGAAAIARAVWLAFKAIPVIIVEEELVPAMHLVVQAIGMKGLSLDEAKRSYDRDALLMPVAIVGWPRDETDKPKGLELEALDELFKHNVGAFIAIEKGARNKAGVAHMSLGRPCTDTVADMNPVLVRCKELHIPSIGIGDGGNEIGMGNRDGSLGEILPFGKDSGCGCGAGIIPGVETDVVLPAVVSNWGGYALAALLAVYTGDLTVMHDERAEARMLHACTASGLIDGATGTTEPSSDGLDLDIHVAFITLLRTVIGEGIDTSAWPTHNSSK